MRRRPAVIKRGDCVELMADMADDSIDAIVCDPPYGLKFMGKKWDSLGDGAEQHWHELWAREALRVLKPGGHLLAFGGTRTYHRLACGIEDAGFEIRDCITWMYGCLTPDVEVLTESGWKRGIDVGVGGRVAQFDPETEAISLAPVRRIYRAPYDGPMRAIRNHDTDQLLTPNHRVVHEAQRRQMTRGVRRSWWTNEWTVGDASTVPRSGRVRLPLAGYAEGPGVGGEDWSALLGWVWTEGHFDRSGSGVRVYQSSSANPKKSDEIDALMVRVAPDHKVYERDRPYTRRSGTVVTTTERTWFFSGDIARWVRADLPGKRPTAELLWRMTLVERRAFLDAAIAGDGSTCELTGSQQFYAKHRADLDLFQIALTLTGQRGRISMRTDRESGSVSITPRLHTELQTPKLRRKDEHYEGDVWCIGVPTGAFVARRDGLVFVTGNSGFPKSHDVSKAIDKAAGVQREVIGKKSAGASSLQRVSRVEQGYRENLTNVTPDDLDLTAPATADAEKWQGWGTALKPASEPIVVARKPLIGTVARNVLEHGTGALNIDATRVGGVGGVRATTPGRESANVYSSGLNGNKHAEPLNAGRWPANVILSHTEDCVQVGTRRVKGTSIPRDSPMKAVRRSGVHASAKGHQTVGRVQPVTGHADADGKETVERWACVPGCPVRMLDAQTGTLGKSSGTQTVGNGAYGTGVAYGAGKGFTEASRVGFGDTGGASRFFYTAKASRAERNAGLDGEPPGLERYVNSTWVNEGLSQKLMADTGTSLRRVTAGSTIRSKNGNAWSMCWCGSLSTDPFHPDMTSIIETMTNSITESTISNSSRRPHTNGCMAAVFSSMTSGKNLASCVASTSPWTKQTGISAKKGGRSTAAVKNAMSVASWLTENPAGGGLRVRTSNSHPT
jgi:hypothetical protein